MDFVSVSTNDTKYLEIFKKDDFSLSLKFEKKKTDRYMDIISVFFLLLLFFFFVDRKNRESMRCFAAPP